MLIYKRNQMRQPRGGHHFTDSDGVQLKAETYDKLVIDNEVLGMCQRVLRGIEVNDDTLATDLLIEKGPAQDYLVEEHTIRHMRSEFFEPALANRERRETYDGETASVAARARAVVDRIRHAEPASQLGGEVRQQILERFPEIRT